MSILMGDNVNFQNNSITNVTSETISGSLSTATLTVLNNGTGDAATITNNGNGNAVDATAQGSGVAVIGNSNTGVAGQFSSGLNNGITVSGGIGFAAGKFSGPVDATAYWVNGKTTSGTYANKPASPASGDLYFATDRGTQYYYDGTRWLTVQDFYLPFETRTAASVLSATASTADAVGFIEDTYSIYLLGFWGNFQLASGTFNSTNKWTIDLNRQDNAGTFTNITSLDLTTTTLTAGGNSLNVTLTANAVLSPSQVRRLYIAINKVGSPPNLTFEVGGGVKYRRIGG